jgi:hypothetical protein
MYGDEEVSWEKGGRRAPTGAFRNPAAEKINQANKILDNPNSSPDMKKAAASILGQEQMLLRQYKDTAARRKQGMAEGKPDVMRHKGDKTVKIVKRGGKPVREIGIDAEASEGNGQYYVKLYDGSYDAAGYDSVEEALAELKYAVSSGMKENFGGGMRDRPGPEYKSFDLAENRKKK